MRIKIRFDRVKGQHLPFNYQYAVSSWVYRVLSSGDAQFAQHLHDRGYGEGNQRFKFFSFGLLQSRPFELKPQIQAMELQGNQAEMILSFYLDQAFSHFVLGLFADQELYLRAGAEEVLVLRSREVTILPSQDFTAMRYWRFRALTPITVSHRATEEQRYATYLVPNDAMYKHIFLQNCLHKYHAMQDLLSLPKIIESDLDLEILTAQPKAKLLTLKPGTSAETQVKGYLFDFAMKAPKPLLDLCYYGGFGEKSSMGFGFVERY